MDMVGDPSEELVEITADDIEAICRVDPVEPDVETTVTREEIVNLDGGTYNEDKLANVWYLGNGKVRITQAKGYGTTAVNSEYIAQPRVYKGHILTFESLLDNVHILSVAIMYAGAYMGDSMIAGVEVDSANNVIECPEILYTQWATVTNGTHRITSLLENGLKTFYLQNSSTEKVLQLRITNIVVTYKTVNE